MKQAVNKAEPVETLADEMTTKAKKLEPNKTELTRLLERNETKLFHRFLEASCDCV